MDSSASPRPVPASTGLDGADAQPATPRYHHGRLKEALLEAGLRALEQAPVAQLSLRGLARQLGVSPTAVYRHMADKDALLAALATKGFERFAQAQAMAQQETSDPLSARRARAKAYVDFALQHPALFELMFSRLLLLSSDAQLHTAATQAFAQLLEWAARDAGVATDSPAARMAALCRWSFVHGLSRLLLDGPLEGFGSSPQALVDELLQQPWI